MKLFQGSGREQRPSRVVFFDSPKERTDSLHVPVPNETVQSGKEIKSLEVATTLM